MTINCLGQLIDLSVPKVMGILNLTPNSFYDGSRYRTESQVLKHVEKMLTEGAAFIDVGAYSSKPSAEAVPESEERSRLLPMIGAILKEFPQTLLSIDTFRSNVARSAIDSGAAMINDIAAGNLDDAMLKTVADCKVPYIMMHMKGDPQTMQSLAVYENVIKEILFYFSQRIAAARSFGITDLIVDPGFGFAKTRAQNYEILQQFELLHVTGLPLLAGISRKSMVYKPLNATADDALNGSTVLHTIALSKGAKILRVHDVKEAVEAVKLTQLVTGGDTAHF